MKFCEKVKEARTKAGLKQDELADHPFYIGVQFHPEFTSRPNRPQPLFQGFISAAFHENTKQEE